MSMDTHHVPTETENHRVARAAGVVGLATMLSRVFGFIRDVIVARFFGAGLATDAFFVAFRIPNLLRRLFAEGSLTIAFVPVFTEYLKTKSREDAFELARVAFTLLSVILVVISLAGVIFSPAIVTVMAPGFRATPDKYALTVLLTRIMFPYIFFISLVALCMGILNSLRHFATPALSPVILNLCMIGAALFLRDYFAEPILALAVGVMIGGLLQLAVQLPVLFKLGVVLRPRLPLRAYGRAADRRPHAPGRLRRRRLPDQHLHQHAARLLPARGERLVSLLRRPHRRAAPGDLRHRHRHGGPARASPSRWPAGITRR